MVCNNKYMYTKENWNPNVYDLNINYLDIASNRRSIFTDELQEVSNKALPASQKSYVQYQTKGLNHGQNSLKINDNLDIRQLNLYQTISINEFRHDTAEYEYTDLFNIKRTKTQQIYTTNIDLNKTCFVEIKTNNNIEYDTAVTMFLIQKGSKTYTPPTPNFTNDYKTHQTNNTTTFNLHPIGLIGNATLTLRTNNTELFKEVNYYEYEN